MYKGYKRRVVVVRDAIEALRSCDGAVKDMLEEASRIIKEKTAEDECPAYLKKIFAFSLGGAVCSVIFTAAVIFFS